MPQEEKTSNIGVFIGEALGEDEKINNLMAQSKPEITILIGFVGYGKTSFIEFLKEELKETTDTLTEIFRKALNNENLQVKVEKCDGIVCPSVAFQEAGGFCALGSDQAPGNNCHNIIHEMKNVCLFNKIKYQNPEIMPAWRALRMATIEGARAIGLGDTVGSLEPGKQADFIAVRLDVPSMMPVYTYPMRNIVPNLVYSARGQEVALSVVNGRVIMKDQKILTIDEEECYAEVGNRPDEIGKRAEKEFFEIHGTNAVFMEEDKL